MTRPLFTLTTDFGLADHYAGTMKGVLLTRCPDAVLVDISHEIEPFSVWAGAYAIAQAAPYFPPDTIHIVVVDPGVGTARRPLLVESLGQQFVGPDNGVLTLILARDPAATVRAIERRDLWLANPSATFHGRDVFAPTAAALANGFPSHDVGPIVSDPVVLAGAVATESLGIVLSVDRFGNVITNFDREQFHHADFSPLGVRAFHEAFDQAPEGEVFYYFGSSGYIEFGMKQASAARALGLKPGDVLRLNA